MVLVENRNYLKYLDNEQLNQEVRDKFIEQVLLKNIKNMYGWGDSVKERTIKQKTIVINNNGYCSELATFKYFGRKYAFVENPTLMVHFIYQGTPLDGHGGNNSIIVSAEHFSSTETNRCNDKLWHSHQLIATKLRNAAMADTKSVKTSEQQDNEFS